MNTRRSLAARRAVVLLAVGGLASTSAFQVLRGRDSPLTPPQSLRLRPSWSSWSPRAGATALDMAAGDGKGTKRRRRKRKKAPESVGTAEAPAAKAAPAPAEPSTEASAAPVEAAADVEPPKPSAKSLAQEILAQERMMYDEDDLTSFEPQRLEEDDRIAAAAQKAGYAVDGGGGGGSSQLEDLFDSREFLQRKRERQLEEESRTGKTAVPTRKKIKRSDVEAYTRLLEMDPTADEDASYFEDEGVDFISALLGDVEPGVGTDSDENANKSGKKVQKKTSFLGIGSGPLQVGHFIGALGVVLMAFVEYPGFPLTNLPNPLRGALQGGLGTIYLINAVLAVFAAISAPSRGQPSLLWGAKTFAVGGIAYDQLMQIPTPEELAERARKEEEEAKMRRGRRRRQK